MTDHNENNSDLIQHLNATEREIILKLSAWEGNSPLASQLADSIPLPRGTVGTALKRMIDIKSSSTRPIAIRKIIDWKPRSVCKLNDVGMRLAECLQRHHHVIEYYLVNDLDYTPEEAHVESNRLITVVSCRFVKKIEKKLNLSPDWTDYCQCPLHISDHN